MPLCLYPAFLTTLADTVVGFKTSFPPTSTKFPPEGITIKSINVVNNSSIVQLGNNWTYSTFVDNDLSNKAILIKNKKQDSQITSNTLLSSSLGNIFGDLFLNDTNNISLSFLSSAENLDAENPGGQIRPTQQGHNVSNSVEEGVVDKGWFLTEIQTIKAAVLIVVVILLLFSTCTVIFRTSSAFNSGKRDIGMH